MSQNPTVEIIEQPASHSMRFRYSCEGRSAGSIMGVNSTLEEKTYPAIRVLNYDGEAVVIVSCVSTERPFRPHPNCLIGKRCNRGVCTFEFTTKATEPAILNFPQLGIQVAKRTEIVQKLEEREFLRIDPFKTGFQHKEKIKFINLSTTRLCFQVLLKPDPANPKNMVKIPPVVSVPIYDKHRASTQLLIHDVSDSSSPTAGSKKIMIFCDKIDRKDIRIRFYENGAGETVVWEDWALFKPNNVHKQVAISFKTPKYKAQDICKPVNVFFHLQRLSDGVISNSIPFQYIPDVTYINSSINTKKRKIDNSQALYEYLEVREADKRQRSKMEININIDPNEACGQNVAGAANFGASASNVFVSNIQMKAQHCDVSNLFVSNNNQVKPQQCDVSNIFVSNNNQVKPQQCDNFKQHDQLDLLTLPNQQLQQQDYRWPQQLHHEQYATNEHTQCEQSQFHQPQQLQPQFHQSQYNQPEFHQPEFNQSQFHQPEFHQSQFHQPQYQQVQDEQSQPHYQQMQQHSQPQYQEM